MNIRLLLLLFFFSCARVFSQDSVVVCIDDSVHSFYLNGSLGSNYNWEIKSSNNIASIISANGSDSIIVKFNSTGVFKLIVDEIDINGCFGTDSLMIDIKENPFVTISSNSDQICEGDSLKITLDSIFPEVIWNTGNIEESIYANTEGDYYARVTDKFGCISNSNTIFIREYENPIADFNYYGNCINKPTIFENNSSSTDSIQLLEWVVQSNKFYGQSFEYIFNNSQQYDVKLLITTNNGCTDSIIKLINIDLNPIADYSFYTSNPIDFDSLVYFTNLSENIISYEWSFGDSSFSNLENPIHTYQKSGVFDVQLTVSDSNLCTDSTIKQIAIKLYFNFYIPNSFTPNENLINDSFGPVGDILKNCRRYKFSIYNRWGERIFFSNSIENKWDGENAQTGLYLWHLEIEDSVGEVIKRSGEVNLYR